jgi:hypothetical protein
VADRDGDVPDERGDDGVNLSDDLVREGLADALDGVLLALAATGGVGDTEVPLVALDRALVTDEHHVAARALFRSVMTDLRKVLGEDHLDLLMSVEETANDVAVAATSVGFRLGVLHRRSG